MTRRPADPSQRFLRLASAIRAEMHRIAAVVVEVQEALADFSDSEPSRRELRGIGDIIHDFYTGTERTFEKIAPELNGGVPSGSVWHRELLDNMTLDLPAVRPPVLRPSTAAALHEYLRFRHLFRNLYGFELEWNRIRPLLERLPPIWEEVRSDLDSFVQFLEAAARAGGPGRRV